MALHPSRSHGLQTCRGEPQSLTAAIPHARLIESQAGTHFIWLGPDWPAIAQQIRDFLAAGPARQG
jgi:hypothetical protein